MTETKTFDALSIGTLTTGIALVQGLGRAQEAASWILGRDLWTHELPGAMKEVSRAILDAYPDFPSGKPDDWRALRADLLARYPDGLAFKRGNTVRTMSPEATFAALTDAEIIVVATEPRHD